ncbi:MAG: putative zinc-finger [Candidatus Krumholzibacteriota bacterium]|nr:putative zinc-finger [Candidatus Krumholzibacteriota bacterium]
MSCEKFEDRLPLYVEGDLSAEERSRVDDHLGSCARCRESLAFYRELETSLSSLRELRPSPARTAAAVSERLGLRPRRHARRSFVNVPAMVSAGFIVLGLVLYDFRNFVAEFFNRMGVGASNGYSRAVTDLTQGAALVSGGSEWVLITILAGVFALVMLTGSWMVLRFLRR